MRKDVGSRAERSKGEGARKYPMSITRSVLYYATVRIFGETRKALVEASAYVERRNGDKRFRKYGTARAEGLPDIPRAPGVNPLPGAKETEVEPGREEGRNRAWGWKERNGERETEAHSTLPR
ncbi:hypothetical protein KM043_017207 [Ampulex compressa]|nr:hypothetical protein KM043_017207 [Ampulex compressa]